MGYKSLFQVVSFDGFDFSEYYSHERTILKPRLEAIGYSNIQFSMGERDSFGPLSRVVTATRHGRTERFVYG